MKYPNLFCLWGEEMSLKNKRLPRLLLCLLLIGTIIAGCAAYSGVSANKSTMANADEKLINEEGLMKTVGELASEKYAGRMAGTEGNEAAALYIAERFREMGLKNPKGLDYYLQRYPQTVITLKDIPKLAIINAAGEPSKEYKYVENFVLRSLSSTGDSIDITAPLYIVKDLGELTPENQEVKGKLLLISWRLRGTMPFFNIIELVHSCGAAGALGEFDIQSTNRTNGALTVTPMLGPWLSGEHSPFVNVDNDTYAELCKAADQGQKASYKCNFKREDGKQVPNVIGLLPGTDEKLKDQYIIIGAHFDHVGQNLDGTFNPGGLDNGSGVAAMLEVARVLTESRTSPGRPVLFIAFNGEESGMLGSEYYAEHPVYPIDNSTMICLDMVGSSEKLPITVMGAEGGRHDLQKEIYGYCQELGIDARKDIGNGSDHASFAAKGVNSVLLIHADFFNGYHTPKDTLEDVNKERIEEIVKLVLHYIDKNAF